MSTCLVCSNSDYYVKCDNCGNFHCGECGNRWCSKKFKICESCLIPSKEKFSCENCHSSVCVNCSGYHQILKKRLCDNCSKR